MNKPSTCRSALRLTSTIIKKERKKQNRKELGVLFAIFPNHIVDQSEVVYCSLLPFSSRLMYFIWPPSRLFSREGLFWVLFVEFLAVFFFRLFLGGGENGEKQRKGVVWELTCFFFSFFPFLRFLFSFFSFFLSLFFFFFIDLLIIFIFIFIIIFIFILVLFWFLSQIIRA